MNDSKEISLMTEAIREAVPTEQIYLFGSFAYGSPKADSDYDFYVVLPNDSVRPTEAIRRIYKALHKVKDRRSVDVLALTKERFDDRRRLLTLEKKVADEGILVYG
jgi:predicted nucleotidyltransferase